MTKPDPEEFQVADTPWAWLAVYAENYVAADRLLLVLSKQLEIEPDNKALQAHVRLTASRRREYYSSIVSAVMACETHRLAAEEEAAV